MRVKIFRRASDEDGAAILIVTLSLVALFGMVALTVDVGGFVSMRRRIVTAADAAALAAAQSCARGAPDEAVGQADTVAAENVPDAQQILYEEENCGGEGIGSVTVTYRTYQNFFFAGIIGAGDSAEVSATATAIWGGAGGGNPVPIEFPLDESGQFPCAFIEYGAECNYWYDNSADHDLADSSSFGLMNLDTWGVDPGATCPAAGSGQLRGWIDGSNEVAVTLTETPTYVCVTGGHRTQTWYDALHSRIGDILTFPINDPNQMVRDTGREKYAIVGFAALLLKDVLRGDDPAASGHVGASGSCRELYSFVTNEQLDLDTLPCVKEQPETISGLRLSKGRGNGAETFVEGQDYGYDPVTHVVTWYREDTKDVTIKFDWAAASTPGACGIRDPDPNAVCVILEWRDVQMGGTEPGGGEDFGLRAIRLAQ